jgi:hypothetical protein
LDVVVVAWLGRLVEGVVVEAPVGRVVVVVPLGLVVVVAPAGKVVDDVVVAPAGGGVEVVVEPGGTVALGLAPAGPSPWPCSPA